MANARQIKAKIKSVKNLQKITRALEIVSTVKLQKTKKRTEHYREFMEEFLRILRVAHERIGLFDAFEWNDDGRRLIVVVSSERWLAGSLNSKLFKHIFTKYNDFKHKTDIFCIGKKAVEFFARSWFNIVGAIHLKDEFEEQDAASLFTYLQESLDQKTYAKIKVYFNYFKNTITQIPLRFKLFPLDNDSFNAFAKDIDINLETYQTNLWAHQEFVYEPNKTILRASLLKQLAEYIIYGAILQNKTGEFAARMLAMKNAKDNAAKTADTLTVQFNKARQGAITQEISEIVSAKIAIE